MHIGRVVVQLPFLPRPCFGPVHDVCDESFFAGNRLVQRWHWCWGYWQWGRWGQRGVWAINPSFLLKEEWSREKEGYMSWLNAKHPNINTILKQIQKHTCSSYLHSFTSCSNLSNSARGFEKKSRIWFGIWSELIERDEIWRQILMFPTYLLRLYILRWNDDNINNLRFAVFEGRLMKDGKNANALVAR